VGSAIEAAIRVPERHAKPRLKFRGMKGLMKHEESATHDLALELRVSIWVAMARISSRELQRPILSWFPSCRRK
jgi:hypothetical protein